MFQETLLLTIFRDNDNSKRQRVLLADASAGRIIFTFSERVGDVMVERTNRHLQTYCSGDSPNPLKRTAFPSGTVPCRSRDSSVGIATGYGLDDQEGQEFESR
jgi:hypothetical protein